MQYEINNKAIFIQIAERICDAIMRGDYREEERLPSVREYAVEAEVNPNTVMRSYERLASKGLIFNRRGIGFFVEPNARVKIIRERCDELMNVRMPALYGLMMYLGITPDDLAASYREYIENHSSAGNPTKESSDKNEENEI